MPRIPYKPLDDAGPEDVVGPIRRRRGGKLIELDRILLYSPPLATGWNEMLGRVRTGLALDGRLREIAMCTVAVLNAAEYEFHHHAPVLLREGGTQAQVDALRDPVRAGTDDRLFDPRELAAIRLSIEMTRDVKVRDETFAQARTALGDDRLLVELVGVIAAYNMVSRVLVAFDITPG